MSIKTKVSFNVERCSYKRIIKAVMTHKSWFGNVGGGNFIIDNDYQMMTRELFNGVDDSIDVSLKRNIEKMLNWKSKYTDKQRTSVLKELNEI